MPYVYIMLLVEKWNGQLHNTTIAVRLIYLPTDKKCYFNVDQNIYLHPTQMLNVFHHALHYSSPVFKNSICHSLQRK